ncbi:DNA-binding response regulator in two-component regulatory system with CpxA [uncultured delta proteobacterium]|uniref:DNA-binding response regulator in two-component regulatory system with CpxA n=1 Tax=uncultured delta proteobacterium TaxID=34034 RepID=A0A212JEH8_9DELT|nr:DNA-binding response regulator in two-component regulatory system with CpxA [uncultured delta proteobacterium]
MQKILIIDDDNELFGLLVDYLQDEGFSCAHAPDAETGLKKSAESRFDIIVLDVMLPGVNGFEVLRRLRSSSHANAVPVLMLTARGEEIDRIVGLEMGADDYLGKPFNPRELVARLRAVLRRAGAGKPETQAVQQVEDISINHAAHSVTANGKQHDLTGAEIRLLRHLVENIGNIVSRDFLYKSIFGHPAYPTDRSLDMLVSRLRKKLGGRPDGGERIKAVRGEGYVYLLSGEQS